MPAWLIDELSPSELNQIVIHEVAHLERRDDWTNLFQKIVKAVLFFHPAVWWIESKMSLEREMACDEAVLARTSSPRLYAQCLARLAETTIMRRSLEFAHAALGRAHQLSSRVAKILNSDFSAATPAWKPAALVATVALGSLIFAFQAPQVIAFKDSSPPVMTAQSPVAANFVRNASWHPVEFVTAPENAVHLAAARMKVNPAPAAMLVVVQTFTYEARGQAIVQTTVWRIPLAPEPNPTQTPTLNQISRKQT
jgi:hypothetical protein